MDGNGNDNAQFNWKLEDLIGALINRSNNLASYLSVKQSGADFQAVNNELVEMHQINILISAGAEARQAAIAAQQASAPAQPN